MTDRLAHLRQVARRFLLMLGGEVTQALFHLAVGLALARALPAAEYGVFALVFLVGGIALTFMRAVAGLPAATILPKARTESRKAALAVTFASAATLFAGAIAGLTGLALLAYGSAWLAVAGAAFVGAWTLRAYLRVQLFARGWPGLASAGDIVFALSGAALLGPLLLSPGPLLTGSLSVLALSHLLGILTVLAGAGEPLRFGLRAPARARYRALWPRLRWSIADVSLWNLQAQGYALLIAALAGPVAYAPIAATLLLFSPLRLSAAVVVNMMQPAMAASLAAPRRLAGIQVLGGATLFAIAAIYGAVLWIALPVLDVHVFDSRFPDAPLGLIAGLIWLSTALSFVSAPLRTLLETRHEFRVLAGLTAASATSGCLVAAAALVLASPPWSLLGLVASEATILIGTGWITIRRSLLSAALDPSAALVLEGGRLR